MRPMLQQGRKKKSLALGFLLLLLALLSSCRLYNLQKKLPPNYADFFSKVRYIITSREEKIFLGLPDSEKDQFIEEFWKLRDQDPDTEENEFKTEYFNRIEESDKLFLGEGKPGWLTDRGRIYILFGPPLNRITNPMESDASTPCSEIWYYGNFPVMFRDQTCTSSYKLVTYDLTPLRDFNLAYMHELSLAQAEAQKTFYREKELFDFSFEVERKTAEPGRIEGAVTIAIPYSNIWLKEEEGILKTEMEVHLELQDGDRQLCWEYKDTFEITLNEAEIKEKQGASFNLEISFVLDKNLEKLRGRKNIFHCRLKNLTGGEELRKVREILF